MTEQQYTKSIETNNLQLTDLWQRFSYYSGSVCLFFVPLMVIVFHLIDLFQGKDISFLESEIWILIIPTILGLLEYRIQNTRLRFQKIETRLTWGELHVIIEDVARQLEWEQQSYDNYTYVGKTNPGFFSMNWGEQITIIFGDGFILFNSVNSPDDKPAIIDMGRNKINRETFINRIKAEDH